MEERVYERVQIAEVSNDTYFAGQRALRHVERDLGLSLRIVWVREVRESMAAVALSIGRFLDTLACEAGEISSWDRSYRPTAFRTEPFSGQTGWVFGEGEMMVRADLTPAEAVRTVAHEAKHIADSRRFRPPRTDEERKIAEQRAVAYENQVAAQLARG